MADACAIALQARPLRLKAVPELLAGTKIGSRAYYVAVDACADRAFKQCHPLDNIPGDHEYRREMVPVYVRRTLHAAAQRSGPVHHL